MVDLMLDLDFKHRFAQARHMMRAPSLPRCLLDVCLGGVYLAVSRDGAQPGASPTRFEVGSGVVSLGFGSLPEEGNTDTNEIGTRTSVFLYKICAMCGVCVSCGVKKFSFSAFFPCVRLGDFTCQIFTRQAPPSWGLCLGEISGGKGGEGCRGHP